MKGLIVVFLLTLATLPAEQLSARSIEGLYSDKSESAIFELEKRGRLIYLKRGQHGQWQTFKPLGRNAYSNRSGDQLRLTRSGLTLVKRHYHIDLIKIPERRFDIRQQYGRNYPLAGQWFSTRGRRSIEVVTFKNGIKVISGSGRTYKAMFYHLVDDWNNVKVFRSDCGESIRFHRNGELIWQDAHGHHEIQYFK